MEKETKDKIERLFLIKQKIRLLEAQASALAAEVADMPMTGEEWSFPATMEHGGFTAWQMTRTNNTFDQKKMREVYARAAVSDGSLFQITVKADALAKVRSGKSGMPPDLEQSVLDAVTSKNSAKWINFKAEVADEQE